MKRRELIFDGWPIGFGLLISVVGTVALAAVIALLLVLNIIPESLFTACVCLVLVLSTFLGSIIAARAGESKIAIHISILAIIYILILLGCGILFLDGRIGKLFPNILCILVGCTCACAICIRKRNPSRTKKRTIR